MWRRTESRWLSFGRYTQNALLTISEAFAPIDKAEAGRLSRIKSEQVSLNLLLPLKHRFTNVHVQSQRLMWQKRRNVLKEGFERLRSMLPPTNQKASKQALLDRGESAPEME